ncbi:putative collagen-binding domain-containing protein [Rhodopirellula sp. SWK7]|uniref:putative collagen-binding domain-containing protein n=1 Tax=Rhodopirellula sp. SWK7 TaxID=595460 RepID=UPI0011819EE9
MNRHSPNLVTSDKRVNQKYCLANPGSLYLVDTRKSDRLTLDLGDAKGDFKVQWYDPARGGELQNGNVVSVAGGQKVGLGSAPP